MRCAKSQKLYNMSTVPLQICNGTDKCCKKFIILYSLFSLLSLHFFFPLLSHSPFPSLFSLYWFPLSSEVKLPSPARFKNKTPAPIQIIAEHILREARERQEAGFGLRSRRSPMRLNSPSTGFASGRSSKT